MAISEKRLREFERWGPEAMARWLEIAATRYFCGARDVDAFRPFELFIGRTESTASDICLAYGQLSVSGMINFRSALVRTLSSLEARPDLSEVWMFLIELSWLLPEPGVVEELKNRFNNVSLDSLCADDPDLFGHIFGYIRNLAPHTQDAAECIRLLVRSRYYHHRFNRQTLLRLCEINPGKWTQHFSLLQDSMRTFFSDINENYSEDTMFTVQNELARDIFTVTGFDRFMDGLSILYRMMGNDDFDKEPSVIDWYWKSLVEQKRIRIRTDRTGVRWISPHDNFYEQRSYLADPDLERKINVLRRKIITKKPPSRRLTDPAAEPLSLVPLSTLGKRNPKENTDQKASIESMTRKQTNPLAESRSLEDSLLRIRAVIINPEHVRH